MIRFLSFLFNKPYETCKGCEILKQQLALANHEKKDLTDTLLSLIKPKVYEQPPTELQPMQPKFTTFSKRRAALEAASREEARVLASSNLIGRPDSLNSGVPAGMNRPTLEELEEILGVGEE